MTVKYETLISQPTPTLATIYEFLGLAPHPTTFEATSEHNKKYFAQWQALAKDPQSSASIQECINKYEARVRALAIASKIWICSNRQAVACGGINPHAAGQCKEQIRLVLITLFQ